MTLAHLITDQPRERSVPRGALSNKQRKELEKRTRLERSRAKSNAAAPEGPKLKTKAEDAPKTALQRLKDRQALSAKQERGLRLYGALVRAVGLSGANGLSSCLGALERVDGGGSIMGAASAQAMQTAEWIADSNAKLERARQALGYRPDDTELDAARAMVIACDLVAGKGVNPREITKDQREQAEIESGLRIAGDLLSKHFDAEGRACA